MGNSDKLISPNYCQDLPLPPPNPPLDNDRRRRRGRQNGKRSSRREFQMGAERGGITLVRLVLLSVRGWCGHYNKMNLFISFRPLSLQMKFYLLAEDHATLCPPSPTRRPHANQWREGPRVCLASRKVGIWVDQKDATFRRWVRGKGRGEGSGYRMSSPVSPAWDKKDAEPLSQDK